MRRLWGSLAVCAALLATLGAAAPASADGAISVADWSAYKAKFLDESGRIVDDANGNISHSEGQGYGLLLAFLADNPADFDRVWAFTKSEMMLRDDGLAVWKWDPAATPHVTDVNNASDGDLLLAYALGLAGKAWGRPELTEAASGIAGALAKSAVLTVQDQSMLMPGASGFGRGDRQDGPVINLSYWVFEAFPMMESIAPEGDWKTISKQGVALVRRVRLGPGKMPPDWLSIRTKPKPAQGFAAEFGYNALRIPLYLVRAGVTDRKLLAPLRDGMSAADGNVQLVDITTGASKTVLSDQGYRVIPALVSCVLDGAKLPEDLRSFGPTSYYPSTLYLLAISFASRRHPECL